MAGHNQQLSIMVIDASAVLSRILPDETPQPELKQVFHDFVREKINFIAPELLKIEIANALKSAVRQARMTSSQATKILSNFLTWPISYKSVDTAKSLQAALSTGLSVYDAQYLVLAQNEKVVLLTLDKKLQASYVKWYDNPDYVS